MCAAIAPYRANISPANMLAAALDPVQFARLAGITPDPWQAQVLRSDARNQILLCSRQAGKSTVSATTSIWEAVTFENRLILVLSPSLRQSQELFRKMMTLYVDIGSPIPATVENRLSLELANGSRIVSLPGDRDATIRGFSAVDSLIIDEASRVRETLYEAVRPMLAVSKGRILLLSTPWGQRGFFHKEWTEGENWHRTKIPATDVPRIDPEWLEAERRRLPRSVFDQEYMCEFAETEDAVFASEDIQAAVTSTVQPLLLPGEML